MIQSKIRHMMEEFRAVHKATPMFLRMPQSTFDQLVKELGESPTGYAPITHAEWEACLNEVAVKTGKPALPMFNEMAILEFKPVATYAGMLVGVSSEYTEMAVAFRVSKEMDTETSGVVYESSLFNS